MSDFYFHKNRRETLVCKVVLADALHTSVKTLDRLLSERPEVYRTRVSVPRTGRGATHKVYVSAREAVPLLLPKLMVRNAEWLNATKDGHPIKQAVDHYLRLLSPPAHGTAHPFPLSENSET